MRKSLFFLALLATLAHGDEVSRWLAQAHKGSVTALAFLPDGRLVTAGEDGWVRIWDALDGRKGVVFKARSSALAVSGDRVAIGGRVDGVSVWTKGGTLLKRLPGHGDEVKALAFSPDGTTLATAGTDGRAVLWDVRTWKPRRTLMHGLVVNALAWRPDGKALAVGTVGTVKVWGLEDPKPMVLKAAHDVEALAWSPDGKQLVGAVGWEGEVIVWDADTWEKSDSFRVPGGQVNALAFNPQGKVVAVAGEDGTVRKYDAASWQEAGEVSGYGKPLRAVAWSPDGTHLAFGGKGGLVAVVGADDVTLPTETIKDTDQPPTHMGTDTAAEEGQPKEDKPHDDRKPKQEAPKQNGRTTDLFQ